MCNRTKNKWSPDIFLIFTFRPSSSIQIDRGKANNKGFFLFLMFDNPYIHQIWPDFSLRKYKHDPIRINIVIKSEADHSFTTDQCSCRYSFQILVNPWSSDKFKRYLSDLQDKRHVTSIHTSICINVPPKLNVVIFCFFFCIFSKAWSVNRTATKGKRLVDIYQRLHLHHKNLVRETLLASSTIWFGLHRSSQKVKICCFFQARTLTDGQ
jgi:hypothetical protein